MTNFTQLGISQQTAEILEQLGFATPTPIQEKAIPMLLSKDPTDFIGLAQTGTGKTAAFGLPLIDLVEADNSATQALIMAPTRELAQQTEQQLKSFTKNRSDLFVEVVYGGAAIVNQIKALKRKTQIIVATPGRLLDLINRGAINLAEIRYVILDEADEMLNMGFKEDIDEILSYTPEERVTWLFSATMPDDIRRIVKKYMDQPLEVEVNSEQKSNKDITHQYVVTKTTNKIPALRRFLDLHPEMRGIMFCRTKRETQQIADDLGNMGYGVEALHGDLSQAQRNAVMKRFKTRSMQLLIATDVAARGIDVNDLTYVIHHTLPDQLESYTHRSGRTGRAGKKGVSLVFINPRENRKITALEKKINVTFEQIEVPRLEELKSKRIQNWADLIVNTKVDPQADELLQLLHNQFDHMSKYDLLKRLITTQLDHLMIGTSEGENDLNEIAGKPSRSSSSNQTGAIRYFINVGAIDGVTKGDLIHFLADVSGVSRKQIQEVTMQKNCSYFNLDAQFEKKLLSNFEDIEVEGRPIRVNRDEDGRRKPKPDNSFRKKKDGYRGRSKRDSGRRGKKRR